MWILAAFTGGVGNYCKSRMSKEEKDNLIFQNKDCDKTRINCLKMDFAEFSMLLFQQNSGRTSQSCSVLASHPVCCTDNTAQTSRHNTGWDFIEWHLHVTWQHKVESAFQSERTLLIAASAPFRGKPVYFQSFCSSPLWLFGVWCMRRRLHAGVWLLVFLFPTSNPLIILSISPLCGVKVCEAGGANRWLGYMSWQIHSGKHIKSCWRRLRDIKIFCFNHNSMQAIIP